MTLKPGVKKGLSLLFQYLDSLFQAFRPWGQAQRDVRRKKKKQRLACLFAPHPTIPTPRLSQANIWIKMYKS